MLQLNGCKTDKSRLCGKNRTQRPSRKLVLLPKKAEAEMNDSGGPKLTDPYHLGITINHQKDWPPRHIYKKQYLTNKSLLVLLYDIYDRRDKVLQPRDRKTRRRRTSQIQLHIKISVLQKGEYIVNWCCTTRGCQPKHYIPCLTKSCLFSAVMLKNVVN